MNDRAATQPGQILACANLDLIKVLDTLSDPFVVLDRQWRLLHLNRYALRYASQPLEALLGRTLWEAYPALLGTPLETYYRRAMAERTAVHFEARGPVSGRWQDLHAYPSPDGLIIYGRDLTERRQTEQALRQSEEQQRLIAELTSDYAYSARLGPDRTVELESATDGFSRVTGYTLEELQQRGGWRALIHPDDRQRLEPMIARLFAGQPGVEEIRLVTKGGEVRWVRFSTQPIWDPAAGRAVRLLGAVQDISERKRAEEACRESEERFKNFMDNSPALAWMKDEGGRYVYINRPSEEHFGWQLAGVRGRTDFELWAADVAEQLRAADRAVLAAGKPLEFFETIPDPDGSHRYWRVFKFPFRDAAGARYVGGMALDVTERRRDEEQLHEYAGRLQTLSRRLLEVQEQERRRLACELHDEIGQLLTGLKLNLELGARLPAEQLRAHQAEAQALVKDLTARVRDLSLRLRPTMLDDLGLLPALLWHFDRYTAQAQINVIFSHHGLEGRFPPDVETAAYRIVQEALTNVARHARVREATVRVWLEQERLHLQIEDSGIGFDPAGARDRGSTSGLSGMEERVTLLGGRLEIESRPGAGTRVSAELPAAPPPPDCSAKAPGPFAAGLP